jgi:hypothetical protein
MLRRSQEQNGSHIIPAATSRSQSSSSVITKRPATAPIEAFSDKKTPKSTNSTAALNKQVGNTYNEIADKGTQNYDGQGRIQLRERVHCFEAQGLAGIGDAPGTYFKPPYVGSSGWIGIELDQIRDEALEIHVREAWKLAARKNK